MSIYIIRKWLYSYICIFFLIQPVIVKIPMILWAIWIIWILHFGKFDQGKKVELQIVLFLFSHFSFCGQKSALWLKISLISFDDLDWRKVLRAYPIITETTHPPPLILSPLEVTFTQVWYIIGIISSSPTDFHSEK